MISRRDPPRSDAVTPEDSEPSGFSNFGLHPELLRGVADLGFRTPTPIQQDAIPPALEGNDILACAMTGSGKTAAFVLPILQRLLPMRRRTTRALILTPTRELAAQIADHTELMATHTAISSAAIFGGVGMGPQEHAFRMGVDILVATPGRLLDHFQYPYSRLDGLEILVLDEADRMLDMGFLPDIRRVLKRLPPRKQTLFFSATLQPPIVELSKEMLKNPVAINVNRRSAPATGITQAVYPVPREAKSALLLEMIRRRVIQQALVFTRTKHRANRLTEFLQKNGVKCERIHGGRSQSQRTQALTGFKNGRFAILVATDIAARGIDVEALEHVVNFDVPELAENYIHRVGRTARASATGDALTLVSSDEEGDLRIIEKAIGVKLARRYLEDFDPRPKSSEPLEVPRHERIAAIKARRKSERERSQQKQTRRPERDSVSKSRPPPVRKGDGGSPKVQRRPSAAPTGGVRRPSRPARGRSRPRP